MPKVFRLNHANFFSLAASLLAVAATACVPSSPSPRPTDGNRLQVVATTGIVADVVGRIGGEHIDVKALMGPGVDPHLYKPTEGDVRLLGNADLIVYNGLHLEGKMTDVLVRLARSRPVVAVAEAVPEDALREPPEFDGLYDPHVWFDVSLWAMTPSVIARELAALDPAHEAEYQANAERVRDELLALDAWVTARISEIPAPARVLVTAHDAFGYFGRRYGMDVIAIQGLSTVSEAGLGDVSRVVDVVIDRGVKAIFVESSVPRRSIQAVVAAVGAKGGTVTIGGELHSDALGAAGGPASTYEGMVRANVDAIVEALK